MIEIEVFGDARRMSAVADLLERREGVSRVRVATAARPGHSLVVAMARPRAVDPLLGELRALGIPDASVTLIRVDVVGRAMSSHAETGLVWEDVLGMAWLNARPIARYLAFMLVAGVVGCYGVIDGNPILIVGAMAVSPDLLPITAAGVGIVGRRPGLAGRAILTLLLGLAAASLIAAALTLGQDLLDLIPSDFSLAEASSALGRLTEVNDETVVVAFAAGIAGMLALETRASSGVGVAISVTTIPAAAFLGVAAGLGEFDRALGALAVLAMNVTMMVLGASIALAAQRALAGDELKEGRAGA